jgi:hypothetical protein
VKREGGDDGSESASFELRGLEERSELDCQCERFAALIGEDSRYIGDRMGVPQTLSDACVSMIYAERRMEDEKRRSRKY